MTSVRIGELVPAGTKDRVSVSLYGRVVDDDLTASVGLQMTGSPHNNSAVTLSLDEAQELAALLTNAVTRAGVLIAKAAEHEQEHTDLSERQEAAMDALLKGDQS
jgi:hypothetical protein